jgi:hypothetical protein
LSKQTFIFSLSKKKEKKREEHFGAMHLEVETISVNSVHCTSLFILQQIDQHVGKGRTIDATYL